jgi:hypothetical protein
LGARAYFGFGGFIPGFLVGSGSVEAVFFFVLVAAGVWGFLDVALPGFLELEFLAFLEVVSLGFGVVFCFPASLLAVLRAEDVVDFLGETASGF